MLKAQIIVYLYDHPYTRLRYIASDLHTTREKIIPALYELKKNGYVSYREHRDMANMELYDEWFVLDEKHKTAEVV